MAVVGGICHSSIARLSKTNSHLSSEDQKVKIKREKISVNKFIFKFY